MLNFDCTHVDSPLTLGSEVWTPAQYPRKTVAVQFLEATTAWIPQHLHVLQKTPQIQAQFFHTLSLVTKAVVVSHSIRLNVWMCAGGGGGATYPFAT